MPGSVLPDRDRLLEHGRVHFRTYTTREPTEVVREEWPRLVDLMDDLDLGLTEPITEVEDLDGFGGRLVTVIAGVWPICRCLRVDDQGRFRCARTTLHGDVYGSDSEGHQWVPATDTEFAAAEALLDRRCAVLRPLAGTVPPFARGRSGWSGEVVLPA